jgi:hypothetical protein
MSIRVRKSILCDCGDCSLEILLPTSGRFPKGWREIKVDSYGNTVHYCSPVCEKFGREELQLTSAATTESARDK